MTHQRGTKRTIHQNTPEWERVVAGFGAEIASLYAYAEIDDHCDGDVACTYLPQTAYCGVRLSAPVTMGEA